MDLSQRRSLLALGGLVFLAACASPSPYNQPAPVSRAGGGPVPVAPELAGGAGELPPLESPRVYAYRPPESARAAPAIVSESASIGGWYDEGLAAYDPAAPTAPEIAASDTGVGLNASGLAPAALDLAGRAEQQRQSGDYIGAAATLERALRIQPRAAYLWNRLARVRLEQGLGSQASNLAARSNNLAGNDWALKRNNWDLIATVRRQGGDFAGAREAERMATGATRGG